VEVLPGETGAGRSTVTVNVAAAIQGGTLEKLDKLRPGDTVRVPRKGAAVSGAAGAVFVFGAIGSQGAVPVDQAPDLLALVARAGGPGPDADLRHVEIVRRDGTRYSHLRVDLRQYLRSSNPAGTVALHPGDTVYLPRREPRNYLYDVLRIVSPVLALTASIIALSRR
jgi:protein involved in polysaccharide export with SLBB domain